MSGGRIYVHIYTCMCTTVLMLRNLKECMIDSLSDSHITSHCLFTIILCRVYHATSHTSISHQCMNTPQVRYYSTHSTGTNTCNHKPTVHACIDTVVDTQLHLRTLYLHFLTTLHPTVTPSQCHPSPSNAPPPRSSATNTGRSRWAAP